MSVLVPTIGLEVHCQLKTATKMFCGCPITHGAAPNTAVCPVCLGHPGALPVVNDEAVRLAIRAGTALGCTVHDESVFARKHYFYPDLPKGYQISQFDQPICTEGAIHCVVDGEMRCFELERIHMEEDAGKLSHDGESSRVDWNRGGTPLIEIVGRPDIHSAEAAQAWMKTLHAVMTEAGVTFGDLEKGHFRCDANVSLGPSGGALGTRVEIKNINSFRFLGKAITDEIARQRSVLDAGGTIEQSTRSWTGDGTVALRSKEDAADYRYFPDPDLLPLEFDQAYVDALAEHLPELPDEKKARFVSDFGLTPYDADILVVERASADFFEKVARGRDAKLSANWVINELFGRLNKEGFDLSESPVSADQLGGLVDLVKDGTISGKIAKDLFEILWTEGGDPAEIVETRGMKQVTDLGAIEAEVDKIIAANPDKVEQARAKPGLVGWFVGQVMKATGGKANPQAVNDLLKAKIGIE